MCRKIFLLICFVLLLGLVAETANAADPADDPNLAGWWKLDDGSGTEAGDSSGYGHRRYGTLKGDPNWGTGRLNGALEFYGEDSNDYVDIDGGHFGSAKAYRGVMGNDPRTITAWVRVPAELSSKHSSTICGWGSSVPWDGGRWWVGLDYGQVFVAASGFTTVKEADGGLVADGTWHHVGVVVPDIVDANIKDVQIYIDGVVATVYSTGGSVGTPINTHDINSTGVYNNVYIGFYAEAPSFQYFAGLIDEVRIYDRALDANEIVAAKNYNLGGMASGELPADGSTNVDRGVTLSWTPGLYAGSHDVYFGTDPNITNNPNEITVEPSYSPGILNLETTYYWRVNEVNDANLWAGVIWSFTTSDSILIDYFEKYVDTNTGDPNLLGTWSGLGGADVNLSTDPKHWGSQSMKVSYDNTNPFYSAASRTPSFSGWTDDGVEALYLFFIGDVNNTGAQLYVELEDNVGAIAKVIYNDANATRISSWTRWLTDLQDFVDDNPAFDLTNVTKITLGIGDGVSPSGTGNVWFDDIRLRRPICWSQNDPSVAEGDINDDCEINFKDFAELASRWFDTGMSTTP